MGDKLARVENETAMVLDGITRAALDPNVNVEKLERLLGIQERLLADHRKTAFRAALARLQEKLPQITKAGVILDKEGRARNKFAKYDDIDAVVRPMCAEEGFSFSFDSKSAGALIEFTCTMAHRDGHAETKTLSLPVDAGAGRNAVQSIGSTTSYARRYLLSMHLNIVTRDEDDDGQGAAGNEPITREQAAELHRQLIEAGGDPGRFVKWLGVEAIENVRVSQYARALKFIDEKKRQRGQR